MNPINKEQTILRIIRYAPVIVVILLSVIFTNIFITQKQELLLEEKITLEEKYILENKKKVQFLTNRIYAYIDEEKNNSETELKKILKAKVYEAHKVASNIYTLENNTNKNTPRREKEDILQSIKTALSAMTFRDGRGYIFMDDINGVKLLNPIKEIEGKNFLNFRDPKGYQFVKTIVQTIKEKSEAYDTYQWYKDNNKAKAYPKISFFKYFAPYNAAIGTGDYLEEFEKELKTRILAKINHMKFEGLEHIFIYDLNGNVLVSPQKDIIGTNRLRISSGNGEYPLRDLIEFSKKNKQGFLEYNSSIKLNSKLRSTEKISYIALFDKWNWIIGSGFYLEGLEKELHEKEMLLIRSNEEVVQNIMIISLLITLLFVVISYYFSKIIEKMFLEYKLNLQKEIKKTIQKEKLLLQQSKMATMGEMIGSIAHQWKQPLGIISISNGILRFAKEEEGLISVQKHADALDNVDYAVKNLSQTIDDFRNFFDPNKARVFFKISTSINDTLQLISSELKNSNIKIIKNIDEKEVYASQNELQQTLINLLKNAKEELVLRDETLQKYIFIDVTCEEKTVILRIKDNADGIPEEIISKIFDPYFTTKSEDGGTGIGLYMCKQIIEGSMKGEISVSNVEYEYESIHYKGAEFKICLPIDYRDVGEK